MDTFPKDEPATEKSVWNKTSPHSLEKMETPLETPPPLGHRRVIKKLDDAAKRENHFAIYQWKQNHLYNNYQYLAQQINITGYLILSILYFALLSQPLLVPSLFEKVY